MSFSVSAAGRDFEYRGNGLGLWAQPSNALRPSFQRLLADVLRFNRAARRLLATGDDPGTLADLVAAGDYGPRLVADYLVPLGSAIWSADPATFTAIPARTFAAFLDHHGMLQLKGRPQWRTVSGGRTGTWQRSIACWGIGPAIGRGRQGRAGADVGDRAHGGRPRVLRRGGLAVHSDQALALLGDPSPDQRTVLGAIRYQSNVATLHTDARPLPRRRSAWASWNAHLPAEPVGRPTVTYWMNRLQRIESSHQICVTLNRDDHIDPTTVLESWTYAHPIYDSAAVAAQRRRQDLQGHRRTWYCGAYWGYGFHEDGTSSAADVCRELGGRLSDRRRPPPSRRASAPVYSALYEGWVRHHRSHPIPITSGTEWRCAISTSTSCRRSWPAIHCGPPPGRPVRFRRDDYLGDPSVSLAEAVRQVVAGAGAEEDVDRPVRLLTNLRIWGWGFMQISLKTASTQPVSTSVRWWRR